MAKIKLTKNELKIQKDALKMYKRYLPTLTLKKQQLQTEIRSIDAKAKEVRAKRVQLEKEFDEWISVFGETQAFKPGMVTVSNIKKGVGNIAGVTIPIYEGADSARGEYDLYETPLWIDLAADRMEKALSLDLEAEVLDGFRKFFLGRFQIRSVDEIEITAHCRGSFVRQEGIHIFTADDVAVNRSHRSTKDCILDGAGQG